MTMLAAVTLFYLFFLPCVFSSNGSHSGDLKNLIELRDSFSGQRELLPSWFEQNSNPCNWSGITCIHRPNPTVIAIDLSGIGLGTRLPNCTGKLQHLNRLNMSRCNLLASVPNTLQNLVNLIDLDLSFNKLSGVFPVEIRWMRKLEKLHLNNNFFVGSIPEFICKLRNLKSLILGENQFTSTLPINIGNLKNLNRFSADSCNLSGSMPLGFYTLTNLRYWDVSKNHLNWELNAKIGELMNIKSFSASSAGLHGQIPKELGACTNLEVIELSVNSLDGSLPDLFNLSKLTSFSVSRNQITGKVPSWIAKWKNIKYLDLANNNFTGPLPSVRLDYLESFLADGNHLSGGIPTGISESKSITVLSLANNYLSGSIQSQFRGCYNLEALNIAANNLVGRIPSYLSNLSLAYLVLSNNRFRGQVPKNLWASRIKELSVEKNQLEGQLPSTMNEAIEILRPDNNHFRGRIPKSIRTLKNLRILSLRGNYFSGEVPAELFECKNLSLLDLSSNILDGRIPKSIGKLKLLRNLMLSENNLMGEIPQELVSLSNLQVMDLSFHFLSGSIFLNIDTMFPNTQKLNLSWNKLTGLVPPSIFEMKGITHLDISKNSLEGSIPFTKNSTWKNKNSLVVFNASNNHLTGTIPISVSNSTLLSLLDLHNNYLTGKLPQSLFELKFLRYLDLSHNKFDGFIPCEICQLSNHSFIDLSGNKFLGIDSAHCSLTAKCINFPTHTSSSLSFDVISEIVLGCAFLFFLLVMILRWIFVTRNKPRTVASEREVQQHGEELTIQNISLLDPSSNNDIDTSEFSLPQVSFEDIRQATENFNESHFIGQGGFGYVYKGILLGNQMTAIKRLTKDRQRNVIREFKAEMETIGKVSHPNLVKLLGYHVSAKGHFLVYEYLQQGSLDVLLKNKEENFGWKSRYKICLGVARSLSFLHYRSSPRIIHRDIKPSNILLDEDLKAKVSDFGLARIIDDFESYHVSKAPAGTIGYLPPEYICSLEATKQGDVYSFGVVMLQLLTGRLPIGDEVSEGGTGNIVQWTKWMIEQGRKGEVFDPILPTTGSYREQMMKVLDIAIECTALNSHARPNMLDVETKLDDADPSEIKEDDA